MTSWGGSVKRPPVKDDQRKRAGPCAIGVAKSGDEGLFLQDLAHFVA
jgi:hypothetical protein